MRTQQCGAARLTARQWCLAAIREGKGQAGSSPGQFRASLLGRQTEREVRNPREKVSRRGGFCKSFAFAWQRRTLLKPPMMTEAEMREAHKPRRLLRDGPYPGTVVELTEGMSQRGNETFRAVISIIGADNTEYRLLDVMSATPLGALKLLHFCRACGCEDEFKAGHIEPSMFIGKELVATVTTEKKSRLFPARNVISDYSAVASAVVPLRRSAE